MERKTVSQGEQKLLILLALQQLGGVTQLQLLRFMVEEDFMNYFVLQLNLCELEEMGQVCMTHQLLGSLYELTEQGRYMLDNFDTRVPASRREAIETAARRWKPRFRAEQQNQADAFPMKDDRQCLRLRMLEGDSALLDMSLTVTKHITEGQLRERWREAAQQVYSAVTQALGADYAAGERLPRLPATAMLQQIGEADWMLSLTDSLDSPTMNLMLSLPTSSWPATTPPAGPSPAAPLSVQIMNALQL